MTDRVDLLISAIYLLLVTAVGLWVGLKKGKSKNAGEYFLAGRSLKWPQIGLALFATNVSCVHLVSLAQSGFDHGLVSGNFEWMAGFVLVLLAVFFVPFYIRSKVPTLPIFLEKRYNKACRDWLTFVSIIAAIVIHISFSMLAGGIVLESLLDINMYVSVITISVFVTIYTVIGGLRAVVFTESIQTIVLLAGAIIITAISWVKLGGWTSLSDILQSSGNEYRLSMIRSQSDPSGLPWYSILLGYPIIGIWYWCADQTIVQRVLGAQNEDHAKLGVLFCGVIKILPVFIFVLPGLLVYALSQKGLFSLDAISVTGDSGEALINSKALYTQMIIQLLPAGVSGILIAALISGLMSQIAGAMNSISSLVSFDVVKRFWPKSHDRTLLRAGRMTAVVSFIIAVALLPLIDKYESIFIGLNDIIAHLAPPITCVFLLGVFWKRASPVSAQITLWVGSAVGVLVFFLTKMEYVKCLSTIPFMMMSFYLFCFCVFVQVFISLVFVEKHANNIEKLYWNSVWEPLKIPGLKGLANYKFISVFLIMVLLFLYYAFR